MAARLGDALFWWSLAHSLAIVFVSTVPVNRWLIARGRGHALMHELHALALLELRRVRSRASTARRASRPQFSLPPSVAFLRHHKERAKVRVLASYDNIQLARRDKMNKPRWLTVVVAFAAAGLLVSAALAGPGGHRRIERAWYQGHLVTFVQPSVFSANPNGGVLACFGLGPDLSGINRPTQPLYVIFDDTATQDHCDGQPNVLRHDHVLPVAPGDPGYTGAWTLVLLVEAVPGSIDLAATPFTSAEQVQAALAAGALVDVTSVLAPGGPVRMIAPVIGGS